MFYRHGKGDEMKNWVLGIRYWALGIGFWFLIFSGCTNKNPEHIYISDEFQHWTVFQKGSYWIYKNDSTLVMDSTFLRYDPSIVYVPLNSSTYPPTAECITILFSSSLYTNTQSKVDVNGIESFQMVFKSDSLFYPWGLLATYSDNFEPNSLSNHYETIAVDSVYYIGPEKFYNVVQTQCTGNTIPEKYTFWFARDTGLIKVTFENGYTGVSWSWSIVRFHIV
jgi:hypothetical protein